MKDVTLDDSSSLQLDAESINITLDAASDGQLLGDNITPDARTVGRLCYEKFKRAYPSGGHALCATRGPPPGGLPVGKDHRSLITMAVPLPPNIGTELPKLVAVNPLP